MALGAVKIQRLLVLGKNITKASAELDVGLGTEPLKLFLNARILP
jgi:hypothetical protein